jgi:hypothetical protein
MNHKHQDDDIASGQALIEGIMMLLLDIEASVDELHIVGGIIPT